MTIQNPTGNQDADHVLTLHDEIRSSLFTGTHDLDKVRKALDEADKWIREKIAKATAPKSAAPSPTPTPPPAPSIPRPVPHP